MNREREGVARHAIRVVAQRTGLSPALLRAWEKRYGAVTPSRSEGGERLYSDEDVHRLVLLHRVVEEGRNISQVSSLSMEQLEALVEEDQGDPAIPGVAPEYRGSGRWSTGLVAATPARERHELGALLSAVSAAAEGWKGVYLGPDLPAGAEKRVEGAELMTAPPDLRVSLRRASPRF
jgi:DNA-binding transcriptional MerR regulator